MAIKQYSLAKDGARQLAPGFKVREFRCRDGSDVVMIDESLVMLLQCIREHFGKPITITSGYRTAAHNAAVGGAKSRIRREPDARLGRRWPLPGQGRPRQRLGTCGHPAQQKQMDAVNAVRGSELYGQLSDLRRTLCGVAL